MALIQSRQNQSHDLFLAIDQGGQSTRVAVYDALGRQLCCYSSPCATHTYRNTVTGEQHVEQNGDEILAGLRQCLRDVEHLFGDRCSRIKAAGFAGQGSSLLCWHKQSGAALSPVLSWQDTRAASTLVDFPLPDVEVQKRTGLRVSAHYGASKMRWCLDNLDAVNAAASAGELVIGPIASYLFRHLLVAEESRGIACATDPGHAQRTLLWNLTSRQWDPQLLSTFAIDPAWLPQCYRHNSHFGDLMLGGCRIPLISCQRDQGASLFARGLPQPDACYVNIGTGAFLQRVSPHAHAPEGILISPLWLAVREPTLLPSGTEIFAWEAPINGAAAALDWLRQQTHSEVLPEQIEAALDSEQALLSADNMFYLLNAVGGLGAPFWRTDLTSRFNDPQLNVAEKIQAWAESLLFQLMTNFNLMEQLGPVQRIYISGGLSRVDGLCQRLADLSGVTICRSHNTDATLQGVAFTTAGLPESWPVPVDDALFHPRDNTPLFRRFAQWQIAMDDWLAGN